MSNKIESKKYIKMSHVEHILTLPDTYIGSINNTEEDIYIYEDDKIQKKTITYIPGLYKLVDEILINARDNICNDKTCNQIDVECNIDEGYISIRNNGDIGIPIEKHESNNNVYIPTMLFGELLTSSNYNMDEEKTTGGRNGYGAKLINIFSTKFIVEIYDYTRKKYFIQEWYDNMSKTDGPKIEKSKEKSSVKVTFYPDFKRFNIDGLNEDYLKLFYKRTVDIAGTSGGKLKITFNGNSININNFKSYIETYNFSDDTVFLDNTNVLIVVYVNIPDGKYIISFKSHVFIKYSLIAIKVVFDLLNKSCPSGNTNAHFPFIFNI